MPIGRVRRMDPETFEAAFDAAVANCRTLSRDEARHFVDNGYVVVRESFSETFAAEVCQGAWDEMRDEHGVDQHDPETWSKPFMGPGRIGYIRTKGTDRRLVLKTDAPRAYQAQADAIGGADRLPDGGEDLAWRDAAIGNLGLPGGPEWSPPGPRQAGWHKDGWHFRHFLNSPEQGLLTVPIYSNIQPKSGGTFIAPDSIRHVAELLAEHPAGLHPDSVQGSGYLIPGLIEQCAEFEELTGEPGDMILLHPYMLHRVSVNPSRRPRFIANMALVLAHPMQFSRPAGEAYSLVELAVLQALRADDFDYRATRPALAFKPSPFRDEADAELQRGLLREEMVAMARRGTVTPRWAPDFGYMTNRDVEPT